MSSEDKSWVFDSLVGFLKGPMWNGPINTFVEQKSIFFESGENVTEELSKIHNEYKNLVDYMLGTYMEEMGITPAEFETACSEPTGEIEAKLHQTLFEQIWAANDMAIFQQMMAEKNLDLQLQALEMIHNRFGVTPQSYVLNFSPKKERCERALEKQVVDLSLENGAEGKGIASPRLNSLNGNAGVTKKAVPEDSDKASSAAAGKSRKTAHVPTAASHSKIEGAEEMGAQSGSLFLDKEKLQKRKEYLKLQRDKLVERKKQEQGKTLKGAGVGDIGEIPQHSAAETSESVLSGNCDINPKTLQLRKALAKRLKEEVIQKPQSSDE